MTKALAQVFSFNTIAKVFLGLAGVLLIRFMPQAEYARYTIALSIAAVVTQTLASSYNSIYIVGYNTLELDGNSSSFLTFQLLSVITLALITLPFATRLEGTYWATLALVIATVLSEYSKTCFQRRQEFFRFSLVEFSRAVLFCATVIVLVLLFQQEIRAWQGLGLQAVCFLFVFFLFVSALRLRGNELLMVSKATRLAARIWKGKYRYLFAYFCLLAVFSQVDVFMLKGIASSVLLATYGAAFRYYTLLNLALGAIHIVLLPAIQQISSGAELDSLLAKHARIVVFFAVVTLLGAWAARWIIPAIDMGKYPASIPVFRILAVSAILSFAFSPQVNLLIRFEDFRFLTITIALGLAINASLNFPLIRSMGAMGSALATSIAYFVVNGSFYIRAKRYRGLLAAAPCEREPVELQITQ